MLDLKRFFCHKEFFRLHKLYFPKSKINEFPYFMNTLISFLIFITAIIISLFTTPVIAKIFGSSGNAAFIWVMVILAAIDLLVRITDLRKTKEAANERLIYPKCGGSFVFAPIWILAFVMSILIIFSR